MSEGEPRPIMLTSTWQTPLRRRSSARYASNATSPRFLRKAFNAASNAARARDEGSAGPLSWFTCLPRIGLANHGLISTFGTLVSSTSLWVLDCETVSSWIPPEHTERTAGQSGLNGHFVPKVEYYGFFPGGLRSHRCCSLSASSSSHATPAGQTAP